MKGAVDMTFITKDVRFAGFRPEKASLTPEDLGNAITGGQPLGGVTAPAGVNGLLGQLAGSIPMLSKTQVPVQVEVVWTVKDENGNPLHEDQWDIAKGVPFDDGGTPKIKGTEITVAFKPLVDELTTTNPVPAPVRRQLHAKIKLTVQGTPPTPPVTAESPADLPSVPVLIPTLLIPKLIAAFRHGEFQPKAGDDDGFVFLMVPGHSPLRSVDQLKTTLATVQETLTTLKSFADLAAFLLRLDSLVSGITASTYFAFAAEDGVPVLNDMTVIQNDLLTNDIELEDEISSMIFIGPPGKAVHWFCEDNYDTENGDFSLKVGPQLFTVIRNLGGAVPVSDPVGDPPLVTVHHSPSGGSDTFNDFLSSVKFE
ncbi:hypothetical protein ACFV9D_11400 [Streptomyces sp. NPDC059875]|uniref:hypothetical protein n=1 Tax=unclassified Streptomyces TaxID=2593676 RepID=UPI00365E7C8A